MNRHNDSELTGRERALLNHFQSHPGRVLSRDELSASVWGFIMDPRSRAVDQTVATLRKKLEASKQIVTHRARGYEYVELSWLTRGGPRIRSKQAGP